MTEVMSYEPLNREADSRDREAQEATLFENEVQIDFNRNVDRLPLSEARHNIVAAAEAQELRLADAERRAREPFLRAQHTGQLLSHYRKDYDLAG